MYYENIRPACEHRLRYVVRRSALPSQGSRRLALRSFPSFLRAIELSNFDVRCINYVAKRSQKNVAKSNHPHITYTLFTGKRLLTTHEAKLKLVVTRKLPRDQEQLKGRITAPTFFHSFFL